MFHPPKDLSQKAHVSSLEAYEQLYRESLDRREAFWAKQADGTIDWFRKWDEVMWDDFKRIGEFEGPYVRFFAGRQAERLLPLPRPARPARAGRQAGQAEDIGDTSTLADASVVEQLIQDLEET